jgi:hypothetical protein
VPAQVTSTIAIPRLQARRGAINALHLTVETGNRNAIDLSLKIRLKNRYRLDRYAQAKHRKKWKLSGAHFASVCAFAIEADCKRMTVSD